ncbi:MAG: EPS-associated MarR family transcriptional regulator [Halieaceae bacterium]|jgi:EPS-associated MarR family transcriptional regulator
MNQDAHYKLLKLLEQNPQASQREIAEDLGVSPGKVNYCIKALIGKGHIKAQNFKNSHNKAAYLYLLTPKGVNAKARITAAYLQRKIEEHEGLRNEIEQLQAESASH